MSHIKKTICIFLFFIIIFSTNATIIHSELNQSQIMIDSLTISSDDTYYSSLFVRDVSDLVVLSLNVSWDVSVINVTDVNTSSFFSDFDSVFIILDAVGGFLDVDAYKYGDEGLSGNISVLRLSIVAVEPLKDDAVCNLEISNMSVMYDSDLEFIEHSIQSNTITIIANEKFNDQTNNFIIYSVLSIVIIILFISAVFVILKKNNKR